MGTTINNLIKTYYDETRKMAHGSQKVRAKQKNNNTKLSHGGTSQIQASGTNPPMKVLGKGRQ